MIKIKKILYPTDFSEPSKIALEYAAELAKQFGAELEILHVMFDETQVVSFYLPQVTMQSLSTDIETGSAKQLDEFIQNQPVLKGINYTTTLIKGTPFIEITKHAKETGADMIVIGTHGRTGLDHVLFGSTAEKVVRKAPCPVFTVRPEK
ncbi:universal stress protein [Geovibrio thiophilus]|uniref:Universal stress protein n=1 Tax=Geovibrio thiophilus TaxID=139438 RepID=A0A3R5X113_9BACT|nr:universal stress protein [Geovibrio thiophilus]QAR31891.1 universal stress protein [Geovibrio thiophilus]